MGLPRSRARAKGTLWSRRAHSQAQGAGSHRRGAKKEKWPPSASLTGPSFAPAGPTAAAKFDWSPMRGRRGTIWPDNDDPGLRYQENVARLCLTAGANEVRCIILPEGLPKGWDLADEAPEGWNLEEILDDAPEYRSDAFRYRQAEAEKLSAINDDQAPRVVTISKARPQPTHTPTHASGLPAYSEEALTREFSEENVTDLRYCDPFAKWFIWNGTMWREDTKRQVFTRARIVCSRNSIEAKRASTRGRR